jgi:SPP1 family predicted phage head-tail adaptor
MIGKHKDRIVISERTGVADGYGGQSETFVTKWQGFAEVEKKSGSKGIDASAISFSSTYEFTLRTNPNISFVKTDKIVWKGRTFGINSIDLNMSRFTVITASCNE